MRGWLHCTTCGAGWVPPGGMAAEDAIETLRAQIRVLNDKVKVSKKALREIAKVTTGWCLNTDWNHPLTCRAKDKRSDWCSHCVATEALEKMS
jgi:hypothetical protein